MEEFKSLKSSIKINFTDCQLPTYDRSELREHHRRALKEFKNSKWKPQSSLDNDCVYRCSSSALGSLTPTSLASMKVDVPAKGSLLLLRCLEDSYFHSGIHNIVEDSTGRGFPICVLNYLTYSADEDQEDLLPVGTIFALKEPTVRRRNELCVICCDSPTDLVFISIKQQSLMKLLERTEWIHNDYLLPVSLPELQTLSAKLYSENKYKLSIDMDHHALYIVNKTDNQSCFSVHSSLSSKYLHCGFYEAAVYHATKALRICPLDPLSNYIAGYAFYRLRKYPDAEASFCKIYSNGQNASVEFRMCAQRVAQSKRGILVDQLYLQNCNRPEAGLDCADFVGPVVRAPQKGRTRGIEATEDIAPGTLLVVSKALAVHFNVLEAGNVKDDQSQAGIAELVHQVTDLVAKNPETFGTLVYNLPVDSGFLDSIKPKLFCSDEGKEVCVDIERIRQIVSSNYVTLCSFAKNPRTTGKALFDMPSFFNHSCLANAHRETFSDVMVIHANRNIRRGEEITLAYVDPTLEYLHKLKTFVRKEVLCTCALCKADRKEAPSVREKRHSLTKHADEYFQNLFKSGSWSEQDIKHFLSVVDAIEDTYRESGRKDMQFALAKPCTCLAYLYGSVQDAEKALLYCKRAIAALGFHDDVQDRWSTGKSSFHVPEYALVDRNVIAPIRIMVGIWNAVNNQLQVENALRCMYTIENVLSGASKDLIEAHLEDFFSKLF